MQHCLLVFTNVCAIATILSLPSVTLSILEWKDSQSEYLRLFSFVLIIVEWKPAYCKSVKFNI